MFQLPRGYVLDVSTGTAYLGAAHVVCKGAAEYYAAADADAGDEASVIVRLLS
jgi:hypothetical protein